MENILSANVAIYYQPHDQYFWQKSHTTACIYTLQWFTYKVMQIIGYAGNRLWYLFYIGQRGG